MHFIYCFHQGGAILEDGDGIELVQRYDPKHDTWTELSPMLIPRSGAATCVLNGQIYVVGLYCYFVLYNFLIFLYFIKFVSKIFF